VTITDAGGSSIPASDAVKVVSAAILTDPVNSFQTALYVGDTSDNPGIQIQKTATGISVQIGTGAVMPWPAAGRSGDERH
jgi:hypothetical protein